MKERWQEPMPGGEAGFAWLVVEFHRVLSWGGSQYQSGLGRLSQLRNIQVDWKPNQKIIGMETFGLSEHRKGTFSIRTSPDQTGISLRLRITIFSFQVRLKDPEAIRPLFPLSYQLLPTSPPCAPFSSTLFPSPFSFLTVLSCSSLFPPQSSFIFNFVLLSSFHQQWHHVNGLESAKKTNSGEPHGLPGSLQTNTVLSVAALRICLPFALTVVSG